MTPCSLVEFQHIEVSKEFFASVKRARNFEAQFCYETSINCYQSAWRHMKNTVIFIVNDTRKFSLLPCDVNNNNNNNNNNIKIETLPAKISTPSALLRV